MQHFGIKEEEKEENRSEMVTKQPEVIPARPAPDLSIGNYTKEPSNSVSDDDDSKSVRNANCAFPPINHKIKNFGFDKA